jgi:hypothetical protein
MAMKKRATTSHMTLPMLQTNGGLAVKLPNAIPLLQMVGPDELGMLEHEPARLCDQCAYE